MKKKIMVVYGGKSGEHEISLRSAASVIYNLDYDKYEVIPVGIDKDGKFFLNDLNELQPIKNILPVKTTNSKPLSCIMSFGKSLINVDVVFPVIHGPLYEDGCLQGLFKLMNVAFVGSDVLSSAISMDKDMTRRVVCSGEIRSPNYQLLTINHYKSNTYLSDMSFPLFVKPCCLGSSVGITKVKKLSELPQAIEYAFKFDDQILIEEGINAREIEVAVLGNSFGYNLPIATVPGEIRVNHVDGFYSYDAKYIESDCSELIIPAKISLHNQELIKNYALEIFSKLKCDGLARVDFFLDEISDKIYFNEINTLPGFTSISMYPLLWEASGIKYADLLDRLIKLAIERHELRSNLLTSYI